MIIYIYDYICMYIYIFTHTYMIIHIYIWLCHVGLYWMMCDSHLKSTVGGSMGLSQSCLWHHENGMSIQQLVSIAIVMSIIDVPFLKDHSSYCYVAVVFASIGDVASAFDSYNHPRS